MEGWTTTHIGQFSCFLGSLDHITKYNEMWHWRCFNFFQLNSGSAYFPVFLFWRVKNIDLDLALFLFFYVAWCTVSLWWLTLKTFAKNFVMPVECSIIISSLMTTVQKQMPISNCNLRIYLSFGLRSCKHLKHAG